MNPFTFAQPATFEQASALVTDKKYRLPVLKGGGVDLVDHLKEGLIEPDLVINIRTVRDASAPQQLGNVCLMDLSEGKHLRLEACATLSEIAHAQIIQEQAPVLAQAAGSAASPQIRNMATAAGNLLQRPRCWYYRHIQTECLKKGGSTCFAVEGENKYHAIFGDGPCHIVHPSNLAPALIVCDGVVHLTGSDRKSLPIADLFHMPDKGVKSEHNLKPGEVVTHITCKPQPKSGFYAIKEKQSFDWPVASAYAALQLDGAKIVSARTCAGAVAPVPWLLPNVDAALKGVSLDDDAALRRACALAAEGARPLRDNAYKVRLLPVAVRRAVLIAAGRKLEVDA